MDFRKKQRSIPSGISGLLRASLVSRLVPGTAAVAGRACQPSPVLSMIPARFPLRSPAHTARAGAASLAALFGSLAAAQDFDVVLTNGRVLDPESQLDAIRHVGIRDGVVHAITTEAITGRTVIDLRGLVVAPGFIDLHQHANVAPDDYWLKVQDGVTFAAELEVGTADVDAWYAARTGKSPIHFGVSVGHMPCRMLVMGDRPAFLPGAASGAATRTSDAAQLDGLRRIMERGLRRGAIAVGFGLQYTPAAREWELIEMFRLAAKYQASCHVHMRAKGETGPQNVFTAVMEVIAAAAITGAPGHVVHVQSTSNRTTPRVLELIAGARARGVDITVECYPYTAGMTDIKSAIFDPGWQETAGITYSDLQWPPTGERLTAESFARYRETGGLVIVHSNPESVIRDAVAHPLTLIASDGIRGHPRHAGTSARILGRYVRETGTLNLMQAVEKLSLMPARRLEARVPAMRNKGRIRVGADADLVIFDSDTVIDRATYEKPDLPSEGIAHVLVSGVFVVKDGQLQRDALPGRPVRAAVSVDD
jgi:N-acyl-D-aspartate/D-glutamate deacylase